MRRKLSSILLCLWLSLSLLATYCEESGTSQSMRRGTNGGGIRSFTRSIPAALPTAITTA